MWDGRTRCDLCIRGFTHHLPKQNQENNARQKERIGFKLRKNKPAAQEKEA
jgi:hypothetical protein